MSKIRFIIFLSLMCNPAIVYGLTKVRIMFLVSNDARADMIYWEIDQRAFVETQIAHFNEVYNTNSQINIPFELAGYYEYNYNESTDRSDCPPNPGTCGATAFQEDLDHIIGDANVTTLRNQCRADIVFLIVRKNLWEDPAAVPALKFIGGSPKATNRSGTFFTTVQGISDPPWNGGAGVCAVGTWYDQFLWARKVFEHEVAHNFNARHSDGYTDNVNLRTVMGAAPTCGACPTIPYMAGTYTTWNGHNIGTAATDERNIVRTRMQTVTNLALQNSVTLSNYDIGITTNGNGEYEYFEAEANT